MRLNQSQKAGIIRAILLDVPKPDKTKRHADLQEAVVKKMTPACRKVYQATPKALATTHTGDTTYNGVNWNTRSVITGDVSEDTLKALLKPYDDMDEEYGKVQSKLTCAVNACSTLKQLETMLPEFKKYFPTETEPTKNLPAVANLVADLTKLGWPKK